MKRVGVYVLPLFPSDLSSSTVALCLVPHIGQRISISFSSPMNFSRMTSGLILVKVPQPAHAGHADLTMNLFFDFDFDILILLCWSDCFFPRIFRSCKMCRTAPNLVFVSTPVREACQDRIPLKKAPFCAVPSFKTRHRYFMCYQ